MTGKRVRKLLYHAKSTDRGGSHLPFFVEGAATRRLLDDRNVLFAGFTDHMFCLRE